MKSEHQQRVDRFMQMAGQDRPVEPTTPTVNVRLLRAKLILEEAFETITKGLKVQVEMRSEGGLTEIGFDDLRFSVKFDDPPDMVEIADGCCDIMVVTTGTLSACGMDDEELLHAVDSANLAKFGPGGHKREDGKWIKPPDWTPPDIAGILSIQLEKARRPKQG